MDNGKTRINNKLNNWKIIQLEKDVEQLLLSLKKDLLELQDRKKFYEKQVRKYLKNNMTDEVLRYAFCLHWDRAKVGSVEQFVNQVTDLKLILESPSEIQKPDLRAGLIAVIEKMQKTGKTNVIKVQPQGIGKSNQAILEQLLKLNNKSVSTRK